MSARLLKCYGYECIENNVKHPKEDLFLYKGHNYCAVHYSEKLKEDEDRAYLYGIIKEYYHVEYPTGVMLGQIKKYTSREHQNYTLRGIAETIKFMATKPNVYMDTNKGIGLVPYLYEEAKMEYMKILATKPLVKTDIRETEMTIQKNKFKKDIKRKTFDFGE